MAAASLLAIGNCRASSRGAGGRTGPAVSDRKQARDRKLQGQFARRWWSIGLVIGEHRVAKGLATRVEGQCAVLRLAFTRELLEHGGQAIQSVGGKATTGGQRPNGVEGPVDETADVHEEQGAGCRHDGFQSGSESIIILRRFGAR